MNKIIRFLKNDIVMTISGLLAIVSCFAVKPDSQYLKYFNFPVLCILFCLMLVVNGFTNAGVFDVLTAKTSSGIKTERSLNLLLCFMCFVSSAFITNDVALITFVPFTLSVLRKAEDKTVIFTVVVETVAANLGSLITPVGNPQNLYIYKYYDMLPFEFFKTVFPLGVLSFALISLILLFRKNKNLDLSHDIPCVKLNKMTMIIFSILFIVCILTVFDVIPIYIMLPVIVFTTLIYDKKAFKNVDYNLLITFIFFFIFVGNAGRIFIIREFISDILSINVLFVSAIVSQFISNVPAATMLSAFTKDASSLLLGVNIGGLGTIIASMASLISYRQICSTKKSKHKKVYAYFYYN